MLALAMLAMATAAAMLLAGQRELRRAEAAIRDDIKLLDARRRIGRLGERSTEAR